MVAEKAFKVRRTWTRAGGAKPLRRGQVITESDLATKVNGKRVPCTNLTALVRSGYLEEFVPDASSLEV